jgi:hypothetical protein
MLVRSDARLSLVLTPRLPKTKMTKPPFGGLSEVIQIPRKSGAGEGARTLDPDLGKVALASRDRTLTMQKLEGH